MRKLAILGIVLAMLMGCITFRPSRYFTEPDIIEDVAAHIVSIAVYYYMPDYEYNRRIRTESVAHRVVISAEDSQGRPIKCIAYIGSGTIVKQNHIITVKHLFDHSQNTYNRDIWVMREGVDHAIKAEIVAVSKRRDDTDDYAVLKTTEDMGMKGLSLSKSEPKRGEKVMFGCSVGGAGFFLRFGWLTKYKWFFSKDNDGNLHLKKWNKFAYNTVYPSGPGDSGSGIFNVNGQLVGIMYCGINVYEEMYCFANPLSMLHEFLENHGLEWLLE